MPVHRPKRTQKRVRKKLRTSGSPKKTIPRSSKNNEVQNKLTQAVTKRTSHTSVLPSPPANLSMSKNKLTSTNSKPTGISRDGGRASCSKRAQVSHRPENLPAQRYPSRSRNPVVRLVDEEDSRNMVKNGHKNTRHGAPGSSGGKIVSRIQQSKDKGVIHSSDCGRSSHSSSSRSIGRRIRNRVYKKLNKAEYSIGDLVRECREALSETIYKQCTIMSEQDKVLEGKGANLLEELSGLQEQIVTEQQAMDQFWELGRNQANAATKKLINDFTSEARNLCASALAEPIGPYIDKVVGRASKTGPKSRKTTKQQRNVKQTRAKKPRVQQ